MISPEQRAIFSYIRDRLAVDPATGLRPLSIRKAAALAGVSTCTVSKYARIEPSERTRFQHTEVSKLLRAIESMPS